MRILLAHNKLYYPAYGGGDKSNRLLVEALAARGHQCRVVCRLGVADPGERARLLTELESRRVAVLDAGPETVRFLLNGVEVRVVVQPRLLPLRLADEIAAFEPNVVLTSTDDPALLLLETALKSPRPHIVYLARTTLDLPFGPDCAFPSAAKTDLLRQADGIVGVSQYVADYLSRWGGLEAVHVPISLLEPGPYPALGRFDNEFVTMVNPCAVKGIAIFLALADAIPEVKFAAVPTWGTTQEDLAALRARPNVTLLPPADNIDTVFSRTRVLLVPSLWAEARSRIIPEAMLRGVPVLASNIGGIPEAMLGEGYLLPVRPIERYRPALDDQKVPVAEVPPQDIGPWLAALERLVTDREHYEALSRLAREKALAYAAGLIVEPFERYLEQICQAPLKRRTTSPSVPYSLLDKLSPEKRRLLALRLKKAAPQAAGNLWFPTVAGSGEAAMRLFCFPFAGGGTTAFRGWAEALPQGVALCPVRLPGRESRLAEPPFRDLTALVAALAQAIPPYLDRPFAFYGHSMGAVVSFELIRLLIAKGLSGPVALFVSGARAPHLRKDWVPPPEPSEKDFLHELERLEGIPPGLRQSKDLLAVVLPALRADATLYRNYVYPGPVPLDCPVFAYGGREDPNIRPEHLEAWQQETSGPVRVRLFPGGHFFIQTAQREFLTALAEDLSAVLRPNQTHTAQKPS
ncbi:MAG: alpha/beta fold hydrolase [Bryobacteraceae bacterium]